MIAGQRRITVANRGSRGAVVIVIPLVFAFVSTPSEFSHWGNWPGAGLTMEHSTLLNVRFELELVNTGYSLFGRTSAAPGVTGRNGLINPERKERKTGAVQRERERERERGGWESDRETEYHFTLFTLFEGKTCTEGERERSRLEWDKELKELVNLHARFSVVLRLLLRNHYTREACHLAFPCQIWKYFGKFSPGEQEKESSLTLAKYRFDPRNAVSNTPLAPLCTQTVIDLTIDQFQVVGSNRVF